MTIQKSVCEKFVRVSIGGNAIIIPIGEFLMRIAKPGEFIMTPADLIKVEAAR